MGKFKGCAYHSRKKLECPDACEGRDYFPKGTDFVFHKSESLSNAIKRFKEENRTILLLKQEALFSQLRMRIPADNVDLFRCYSSRLFKHDSTQFLNLAHVDNVLNCTLYRYDDESRYVKELELSVQTEWSTFHNNESTLIKYFDNGSAAVQYCLVDILDRYRPRSKNKLAFPSFLFFEKCWISGVGMFSKFNEFLTNSYTPELALPLTIKYQYYPTIVNQDLSEHENSVLKLIKKKNSSETIAGILLEPVTAQGIHFFNTKFLLALRALCDKLGILIICDECITSVRTGKNFAYKHYQGFIPDLLVFGKGLEIGGVAYCHRKQPLFSPSAHIPPSYSTFPYEQYNMLRFLATLKFINKSPHLYKHIIEKGEELSRKISEYIQPVRSLGLLLGIDIEPGRALYATRTQHGGMRLTPPLDITEEDIKAVGVHLELYYPNRTFYYEGADQ